MQNFVKIHFKLINEGENENRTTEGDYQFLYQVKSNHSPCR